MNKKIVFLPYDMDTAIGINNEGALVLDYNLEDTDQIDGADVFNGQDSVLWCNLRDCFPDELKAMYQQLRSSGALSYDKVEQMFEEHQAKWPEAIFNEDAFFKYIQPLIDDGDESYLSMLQGSKKEQRRWWLYNRFKYIDSKYNAGDSLTDRVQLRGYNKANITLTPYADIYASIKWGSYLDISRAPRNVAKVMVCPMDRLNDTEIYIYSASQLSSLGDLSGLKVGFADFHNAVKLQELILGSAESGYSNLNLRSVNVGNLKLLRKIDVRNCAGLGTFADQKTVDLSGCTGLEEVYFDGTAILGVELPNGGFLKKLHLPGTITNLTVRNQSGIIEFVCPDLSHISTLNLEGTGNSLNIASIIAALPYVETTPDGTENPAALNWYELDNNEYVRTVDTTVTANKDYYTRGTRVRLFNYYWNFQSISDVNDFLDLFDGMTGIDQNGDNTAAPQIYATVHVPTATGDQIDAINARYPDITVDADVATYYLRYYNAEGTELLYTETVEKHQNGSYAGTPSHDPTAQYTFAFAGWSTMKNSSANDPNATKDLTNNRNVYAAYTRTVRTYIVTFKNSDGTVLQTVNDVPYGGTATYTGETPVHPTDSENMQFLSFEPTGANIVGPTNCIAQYLDLNSDLVKYLGGDLEYYDNETVDVIGGWSFASRGTLTGSMPIRTFRTKATRFEDYAAYDCRNLTLIDLAYDGNNSIFFGQQSFGSVLNLEHFIIRSQVMPTFKSGLAENAKLTALSHFRMMRLLAFLYVPNNLLQSYKANNVFKTIRFAIRSIDDYPIGNDASTISLTWTQIKAVIDDESFFSGNYAIGDIKKFTYNDGTTEQVCYAEIRYIDTVNKYVDFVTVYGTESLQMANVSEYISYSESNAKARLDEIYANELQSDLKNVITPVTKQYYCYDGSDESIEQVTAPLWLMNSQNAGFVGTYLKENDPNDHALFDDNGTRIKMNITGSMAQNISYLTGSRYKQAKSFITVASNGASSNTGVTTPALLVFCFRIAKSS